MIIAKDASLPNPASIAQSDIVSVGCSHISGGLMEGSRGLEGRFSSKGPSLWVLRLGVVPHGSSAESRRNSGRPCFPEQHRDVLHIALSFSTKLAYGPRCALVVLGPGSSPCLSLHVGMAQHGSVGKTDGLVLATSGMDCPDRPYYHLT